MQQLNLGQRNLSDELRECLEDNNERSLIHLLSSITDKNVYSEIFHKNDLNPKELMQLITRLKKYILSVETTLEQGQFNQTSTSLKVEGLICVIEKTTLQQGQVSQIIPSLKEMGLMHMQLMRKILAQLEAKLSTLNPKAPELEDNPQSLPLNVRVHQGSNKSCTQFFCELLESIQEGRHLPKLIPIAPEN